MSTHGVDVLIVGGGVVGLSTAYAAAQRGLKVTLLERESSPGQRASWAGAGMLNLRPWPKKTPGRSDYQDLMSASIRLHELWAAQLFDETGIEVGFKKCGALEIFSRKRLENEGPNFQRRIEGARERGVPVEALTPEEARRMEPQVNFGDSAAVLHYPADGQVRNPWLMHALTAACLKRGVTIRSGVDVKSFRIDKNRIAGALSSSGELIEAEKYVVCGGAWTGLFPELAKYSPRMGKIEPIRGQLACFQAVPGLCSKLLMSGHHYLVPRGDGIYLSGATSERVGFEKTTTPEGQAELKAFADEVLPGLRSLVPIKGWADFRPGLKGKHPLLGNIPGLSNALIGSGHYRNGVGLGPISGEILADIMVGRPPQLDISPWFPESEIEPGGSSDDEEP